MAQHSTGQAYDTADARGQGSAVITSDVADRRARCVNTLNGRDP